MKTNIAFAALSTFLLLSNASDAASVTIDFSVSANQVLPYSEDGYSLQGNELDGASGNGSFDPFGIVAGSFFSSNTFIGGGLTNGGLRVGEGADFTRDDGGLFSLTSFKYRSAVNGAASSAQVSDAFDLLGYRNGTLVVDYGNFSTNSGVLLTENIVDVTLIDSLSILGTLVNDASPIWDDFVFTTPVNPVPLPAGLPLLGAGLLAFGLFRKAKI